jgi:excisionase family DNA binding protein
MTAIDKRGAGAAEAARLLSIKEACRILGLSRTTLYGQLASGRLRSVTVGRRRFIRHDAIEEFIAGLRGEYRRST